jgi:hypothetical protein
MFRPWMHIYARQILPANTACRPAFPCSRMDGCRPGDGNIYLLEVDGCEGTDGEQTTGGAGSAVPCGSNGTSRGQYVSAGDLTSSTNENDQSVVYQSYSRMEGASPVSSLVCSRRRTKHRIGHAPSSPNEASVLLRCLRIYTVPATKIGGSHSDEDALQI